MAFNNSCDYQPTQYNLQTGGANNTLNNVAPSATTGVPFISQGSASQPVAGTAVVAGGGTGDTSFTAYSVICGGTTSTGALQNVSGVGTSGQFLTSGGAGALPTWTTASGTTGFSSITVQTFTVSGTYTPTASMKYCIVEAVGGGGGSGAASASAGAGGGGAGAYVKKVFAAATIGASQTVTIGAAGTAGTTGGTGGTGGATSLGSLITANGGLGGVGTSGIVTDGIPGGAGGTGTGGDLNMTGDSGVYGCSLNAGVASTSMQISGFGGSNPLGFGGTAQFQSNSLGVAGVGFGAGAGGANDTGTARNGAAGTAGFIVVTEFI